MKFDSNTIEKQLAIFFLLWAIGFGIIFHIYAISKADFPLGDGGMFFIMVKDLQQANFHLPKYTSYNNGNIPFVYPPLSFYIYAIINKYIGINLLILFKLLPTVIVILSTFCYFLLSYKILKSYLIASFSTVGFSLHPTFLGWLIMGGGITRSLGLFFSLLALLFYYELFTKQKWYFVLLSSIFGSLLLLSHPEWALQTYGLIAIAFIFNKPNGKLFVLLMTSLSLSVLIISPWLLTTLKYHGLTPFLYAYNSGFRDFINFLPVLMLTFSESLYFPIFSVMTIFGLIYQVIRRSYLLPLWLVLPFFIDPRVAPQIIIIPASMLFSIGVMKLILLIPIWIKNQSIIEYDKNKNESLEQLWKNNISKTILGYILIYLVLVGFAKSIIVSNNYLSLNFRESFDWIKSNIKPLSKFYVITGYYGLEDYISEWFPALSNSISVNTSQGSEWLNNFYDNLSYSYIFSECNNDNYSLCIASLIDHQTDKFDYIFLVNDSNRHIGKLDSCVPIKIFNYLLNYPTKYKVIYNKNSIYIFKLNRE